MGLTDLLKKNRIICPHCSNGFDLGTDLKAISESAGNLLDKLGGFFSGGEDQEEEEEAKPVHPWILHIAGDFDVSPSEAKEMLETALMDDAIVDAICDFLEGDNE